MAVQSDRKRAEQVFERKINNGNEENRICRTGRLYPEGNTGRSVRQKNKEDNEEDRQEKVIKRKTEAKSRYGCIAAFAFLVVRFWQKGKWAAEVPQIKNTKER